MRRSCIEEDMADGYELEVEVLRGGATDFKVGGTKQDSLAPLAKNFFVPLHFSKQANISRGLLNILKFAVWLSH